MATPPWHREGRTPASGHLARSPETGPLSLLADPLGPSQRCVCPGLGGGDVPARLPPPPPRGSCPGTRGRRSARAALSIGRGRHLSRDSLLREGGHGKPSSRQGDQGPDSTSQAAALGAPCPLCVLGSPAPSRLSTHWSLLWSGTKPASCRSGVSVSPVASPTPLPQRFCGGRVGLAAHQGPRKPGAEERQVVEQEKRSDLSSRAVSASVWKRQSKSSKKILHAQLLGGKGTGGSQPGRAETEHAKAVLWEN